MSSQNEPIESNNQYLTVDHSKQDPLTPDDDHEVVKPKKSRSSILVRTPKNDSFAPMKPRRTVSKLRRLAVRESALQKIFFPHHDHKLHLVNEHLQKHGKDDDEDFEPGQLNLRGRIVWFVHSKSVQTFLLMLLLLDVFVVIAELIIMGFKDCNMHVVPGSNDGLCNVSQFMDSGHDHARHFSALSSSGHAYGVTNSSGYFPPMACGVHSLAELNHDLHTAEEVLFWVSIGILSIFALELVTLFVCMLKKFFTVVYILDVIIVGVSLGLSLGLPHGGDHHNSATGLIIFVRCWRFARILHGFGLTIHEVEEVEEVRKEGEEMEEKLEKEKCNVDTLCKENEELRQIIKDLMGLESAKDPVCEIMRGESNSSFCLRKIHKEHSAPAFHFDPVDFERKE